MGLALFYLLFKVMSGSMFFYYSRSTDFIGREDGLLHARAMGKKFKPVFKDVKIVPLNNFLLVEGVMAGSKRFKRLEKGVLKHEILI